MQYIVKTMDGLALEIKKICPYEAVFPLRILYPHFQINLLSIAGYYLCLCLSSSLTSVTQSFQVERLAVAAEGA